jgi:hypothetical protein
VVRIFADHGQVMVFTSSIGNVVAKSNQFAIITSNQPPTQVIAFGRKGQIKKIPEYSDGLNVGYDPFAKYVYQLGYTINEFIRVSNTTCMRSDSHTVGCV